MQKGFVLSIISAVAFGLLPIIFIFGFKSGLTIGDMLAYRFGWVSVMLFFYLVFFRRKSIKLPRRTLLMAFIAGFGMYTVQSYCFGAALEYVSAATASLLLYIYPMTVFLLSALIYKTPFTRKAVITLVLIFIGCICVFFDAFLVAMNTKGILLGLGAMFTFSIYLIFVQKSLIDVEPTIFTLYVALFAAIHFTLWNFPSLSLTPEQYLVSVSLGITSVIAIVFLYKAIGLIGSAYASVFSSIEPVVTMLVAAVMFGDDIRMIQMLGMVFIVGGIVLPNLKDLKVQHA